MEQLRVILIILGVVLIGGIWLADRLRRRRNKWPPPKWDEIDDYNPDAVVDEETLRTTSSDPSPDEWVGAAFSARRNEVIDDAQLEELKGLAGKANDSTPDAMDEEVPVLHDVVEFVEQQAGPDAGQRPDSPPEEVIVLTLMADSGRRLRGPLLLKTLQECGLSHGEMEIFHYRPEGQREALFSAANILEPGTFILSEIAQTETPGIALFMRLPTALPGDEALRILLQQARQIAARLNATLCDAQREPLDEAALAALEMRAAAFSPQR